MTAAFQASVSGVGADGRGSLLRDVAEVLLVERVVRAVFPGLSQGLVGGGEELVVAVLGNRETVLLTSVELSGDFQVGVVGHVVVQHSVVVDRRVDLAGLDCCGQQCQVLVGTDLNLV